MDSGREKWMAIDGRNEEKEKVSILTC